MTTKIPVELSSTPGIVDNSNATAITIDSSENIGIGTSSPASNQGFGKTVEISDAGATTGPDLMLTNPTAGTDEFLGQLSFNHANDALAAINAKTDGATDSGHIQFQTQKASGDIAERLRISGNNLHLNGGTDARIQLGSGGAGANQVSNNTVHIRGDGTSMKLMAASGGSYLYEVNGTEKMRLESTGKLTLAADAGYIGDDTSGILQLRTHSTAGGWGISARNYTNTTTGYWYIGKQLNGTNIFSMTSDSDSIDLNFLSDERMKMNITDSADVLDKVKQITVKDFDWRTELNGDSKDDSRPSKEYGFIAQNFQDIGLGQYVKELMPTDESDDTLGMDYGNITPILVKAMQEQQAIIETQQTTINDLKSRIETLEGS